MRFYDIFVCYADNGSVMIYAAVCLTFLSLLLMTVLHGILYRTVRIYNWDGKKYCYLGRAFLHRNGGGYQVNIGERMADMSFTTLYQICPSRRFVRRNQYEDMMLCAGNASSLLHVEENMSRSIYYR